MSDPEVEAVQDLINWLRKERETAQKERDAALHREVGKKARYEERKWARDEERRLTVAWLRANPKTVAWVRANPHMFGSEAATRIENKEHRPDMVRGGNDV